jgi:hypothetical protein
METIETATDIKKHQRGNLEQAAKNIEDFVAWSDKNTIRELLIDVFSTYMKETNNQKLLSSDKIEDLMFDLKLLTNLVDAMHTIPLKVSGEALELHLQ